MKSANASNLAGGSNILCTMVQFRARDNYKSFGPKLTCPATFYDCENLAFDAILGFEWMVENNILIWPSKNCIFMQDVQIQGQKVGNSNKFGNIVKQQKCWCKVHSENIWDKSECVCALHNMNYKKSFLQDQNCVVNLHCGANIGAFQHSQSIQKMWKTSNYTIVDEQWGVLL